jgi:hypothetical protein
MSNEACTFALRNALNEVKSVCPEVTNTFVFRENGELVAQDQTTTQETVNTSQEAFKTLSNKSTVIGDIESVTFKGQKARANITRFQEFFVANVASNEVDEKTVTNLTHIMIPTMLKLVREMYPAQNIAAETTHKNNQEESRQSLELLTPGPVVPQASTLTVENIGFSSFLKDTSIALIDTALIAQWNETYGDNQVTKVSLENSAAEKILECQFKPFKESKYEGRGLLLLSEKNQTALDVKKGEQILIKPIIGQTKNETLTFKEAPAAIKKTGPAVPESVSVLRYEKSSPSPNVPVSQCIVENVGGVGSFLGNNDFARVDTGLIVQWKELFGDKKIQQIIIEETVAGRKLSCKFKPMKGSDLEGKGAIQLPEKMQQALQIKKGALVVVKPVVED